MCALFCVVLFSSLDVPSEPRLRNRDMDVCLRFSVLCCSLVWMYFRTPLEESGHGCMSALFYVVLFSSLDVLLEPRLRSRDMNVCQRVSVLCCSLVWMYLWNSA
jgi:hypothetical protein